MLDHDQLIKEFMGIVRESIVDDTLPSRAHLYTKLDPKTKELPEDGRECLSVFVSPDLTDDQMRYLIYEQAFELDGTFVLVSHQYWYGIIDQTDPGSEARVKAAAAEGTLDKLPDKERGEMVRVYAEWPDKPIRMWQAQIVREGEKVDIDSWEEMRASLPRPEFKRYLVEVRDGNRILKLPGGLTMSFKNKA